MWFRLSLLIFALHAAKPNTIPRGLHHLMTSEELSHFFGVENPSHVNEDDYEIVYIKRHGKPKPFDISELLEVDLMADKRNPADDHAHFAFNAYGKEYNLKLKPNVRLAAPNMRVVRKTENGDVLIENDKTVDCHFLHAEGNVIAALSHCHEEAVRGFVIDGGKSLEVRPLTPRLKSLVPPVTKHYSHNITFTEHEGFNVGPHIVRYAEPLPDFFGDVAPFFPGINITNNLIEEPTKGPKLQVVEKRKINSASAKTKSANLPEKTKAAGKSLAKSYAKTLELGLFIDEAAYRIFRPYLNNNDRALRDLVLAFVNGMQAMYHLASLGTRVDLTIVYMEFQAKQPSDLPHFDGERGALLDSFCKYNKKINPKGDNNDGHWDMGLYLSGLDFFAVENGKRNFVTMGLSTVTGVCTEEYSCVIGEFGVVNQEGRPYPSTGFTSIYVMAHEIGHNLGMSHDSTGNACPKDGFIMSPSRGVVGETKWSTCSASFMASLNVNCMDDFPAAPLPNFNHNKYGNKPGQMWNADDQCRLLLRDRQASVYDSNALLDACNSLKCKTPNRDGIYLAGPALDGTICGQGQWCYGGDCVRVGKSGAEPEVVGGWTEWEKSSCTSGCLEKSKGAITSKRFCENPKPVNTLKGCDGISTKVDLCDDSSVCPKRVTSNEFATEKCKEYSKHVKSISASGPGIQAPYSAERPWQSCSVFCKRSDNGNWYTPRLDLNDLPELDSHFPDGTWCHNDGNQDYFCVQRLCIPGDKKYARAYKEIPEHVIHQHLVNNAPPNGALGHPPGLEKHFELDQNLATVASIDFKKFATERSWNPENALDDNDFITI